MPKNLLQKIFFFTLACMPVSATVCGQAVNFDTILNRINADLRSGTSISILDSTVTADRASMINSDSAWADVNYTTGDGNHLGRVQNFANAYTTASGIYYGDANLYQVITKAIAYWYRRNPVNSNWYYNVIGFPQSIGRILILMRYGNPQLSSSLENNMLARMNNGAANHANAQTGSNESDVALHYVYRATLTKDNSVMDTAYIHGYKGIVYTTGGDGITYDNCYLAHTGQLGINSYGYVFLSNAFTIPVYLQNTSWSLPSDKLDILTKFYKDAFLKAGKNGYMDYSVNGRGISRGSGLNHDRTIGNNTSFLSKARLTAPALNTTWDSVAAGTWQTKSLHTHFWRADYDIHQRNGYAFNVHMVSSRTRRTERGNGENLLGKFLPDGATAILRMGFEYKNIFPIWEWDKIPGVTSRDFSTDAGSSISVDWGEAGTGNFTGGVSDGLYGASVYDMNYNSVNAKKSWFFFDDEMVCLGAGITSTQIENIATTINQSWLYGDVTVSSGGSVNVIDSNTNGLTQYTNPQWILHDSIGYFFPSGGNISLSNQSQSGSWYRINTGYSSETLSGKVFKLWFNHGAQPSGATYTYIVTPGKKTTTDMQNYQLSNIRIIKNTDSVQAVRHTGLDIMQVVFYKAGTLTDSTISITADKPCVVQLNNLHSASVPFYIADPSQQNSNIKITVQLPGISGTKQLQASLPTAPYAGSTVFYTIDSTTHIAAVPNPDSLGAVADAYVRDGSYATTNYGTATGLPVKQDGTGYSRQAYFKFDLSNVTRPVTGAKLRLYSAGGNTTANTTQWALYTTSAGSWTEGGITWNNKPSSVSLIATRQGQVAAGYVDWDITNAVNNLPADSLLSFQLISTVAGSTTDATFYSRETGNSNQRPFIMLDNTIIKTDSIDVAIDAFVKSGSNNVNTNFGYNGYLGAQYGFYETYLKFDLHNIPSALTDAKLKLYALNGASTQWQLYKVNNNTWTESGITWNNKPNADTLLATITAPSSAGYVYWSITNQLKNISADSLLSLKVIATANVYTAFASRQATTTSQTPEIVYSYQTKINAGARYVRNALQNTSAINNNISKNIIQNTFVDVYPNPVINTCYIQSHKQMKNIVVFDAKGTVIMRRGNINTTSYKLPVNKLKGVYFIYIKGDGFETTKKIVR